MVAQMYPPPAPAAVFIDGEGVFADGARDALRVNLTP